MFPTALFTIDKGKSHPNAHQWMNGKTDCGIYTHNTIFSHILHIVFHTMEYYPAIKRNEVLIDETYCKRKKPDTKDHILKASIYMKISRIGKCIETENRKQDQGVGAEVSF